MQVGSTRLGDLEVDEDSIIHLPRGILGFEPMRQVALIDHDGDGTYWWLQSLDDPQLSFLAVVPWPFFPDYEPEIDGEHEDLLDLHDPADALVLCLVTIRDVADDDGAPSVTANLLGPVVVNTRTRTGTQVVLNDSTWPLQAPLAG